MRIPIVDKEDNIIEYKEREDADSEDIRRIVVLHVFNQNNQILIAKRQNTKAVNPNKWGPSVAGTVDEGYDYDDTLIKETEEEIGLINIKPIFYKKLFYDIDGSRFTGIYYVKIDSININDFKLQQEEVSEVKWIDILDLERWYKEKPEEFVPAFKRHIEIIKEIYENQN